MIISARACKMDFFKAFGNKNRVNMLKILMNKETHISGLAKQLNISVPVAFRHVKILEEAGFVERQKLGSSHIIKVKENALERIKKAWALFEEPLTIEVPRGTSLLGALKKVSGLKIEQDKTGAYITEVDGKKGYYIYEVNGKLPSESVDKFIIERNVEVELKLLSPVIGKKTVIKAL